MKSIILMGIKHCGKSTQAKLVAKELKMPVFDTDSLIEESTGFSPREIFSLKGEGAFKEAELEACRFLKEKTAFSLQTLSFIFSPFSFVISFVYVFAIRTGSIIS